MRVGVLTISDRTARGERPDTSGPLLCDRARALEWEVVRAQVVADDQDVIESILIEWADGGGIDLVLTTGGTGVAARDRTPEATQRVIERSVPGLAEGMRAAGLTVTPHAMLSRGIAGIRRQCLIVNLPGNPRAAQESLAVIEPALPHAVSLLQGAPDAESGHRRKPKPQRA